MWMVRHATMLMLMVAFLLPSGVYRRCCCTQRATSNLSATVKQATQATEATLPPCCLAKAKLKLAARSAETKTTRLTHPPCRCSVSNSVAVVVSKTESIANIDDSFVYADRQETAESLSLTSSAGKQIGQSEPIARPPLRSLLCRWVI